MPSQPSPNPTIVPLADRPADAEMVARWQFEEWGPYLPGEGLADRVAHLASWTSREAVPFTYLVVANDRVAGSASVVVHDMVDPPASCADLKPWLSCVFVHPDHRHCGLGSLVVGACEQRAAELGHSTLYLYTGADTATGFYEPMGWRSLDRPTYRGEVVVVMAKEL